MIDHSHIDGPPYLDLRAFRSMFPALERVVWLNTPGFPPGARPVLDALRRVETEWEQGDCPWQEWESEAHATRQLFARLIGGTAESVALVSSLAEAAATVASSLPCGRVVVGEREFRSNLFPWLALEGRGFEIMPVPAINGVVSTEALCRAIDERTVLVAISEVQSASGFRVQLAGLAQRCHEVGARLFVNLTQSLGALRFNVDKARPDFVAAHGYKWLLSPRGAGWLYVRPDRLADINPLAPNWKSVSDPYATLYGGPFDLAADARKLDTSLAWFPWVGARAALELVLSLDSWVVESRCLELARAFRDGAHARGFPLIQEEVSSHIVSLVAPDSDALERRLAGRRVKASVRDGFLRLGFHAFNDESDVEAALEALGYL